MMKRKLIAVGLALVVLGLVVSWIGLNVSADFADLGQVAVSRGDDGSVPSFVLIPVGLLIVAGGGAVALAAARRESDQR